MAGTAGMVVEAAIQTINAGCSIDGAATPMTNVGIPVIEDTVPTIGVDSPIIEDHSSDSRQQPSQWSHCSYSSVTRPLALVFLVAAPPILMICLKIFTCHTK